MNSGDTFIKYYERALESEVYCISSILDPRTKARWVESASVQNPLLQGFCDRVIDYVNARCDVEDPELQSPNSQQTVQGNFFDNFMADLIPQEKDTRTDIERYLSDPIVRTNAPKEGELLKPFSVLDWWRDVGADQYPKLKKIVRQLLSVPCSSACVERIFNAVVTNLAFGVIDYLQKS